jgi:uncharacterized protein with HEPN domain
MKDEFLDYIEDAIEAMNNALTFIDEIEYEAFAKDTKTIYAVIRAIEIIGEAAKNIPKTIKDHYPQIPWKEMVGMRDKMIHEYFGVDLKRVYSTIKKDIPDLKPLFEKILKDHTQTKH